MKRIIKCTIFILIFCALWHYTFSILWLPRTTVSYFYDEPDNSLDIIYIGGSNAHHHFNNMLAYDLYGFTTYFLSSGIQPFALAKYLIEESEKTQKPELYIVDLARLPDDLIGDYREDWSRYIVDSMKNSKTRINAINDLLGYAKIDKFDYINYYFSFFKYHNSWKNVNEENFQKKIELYKSYFFYSPAEEINPQPEFIWTDEIIDLQPENQKMLLDLLDYIKLNNLNVLFVIPKSTYWTPGYQRLNAAASIIKEYNFDVINFNTLDDLNIDYATDFYDDIHLNVYGATKYTLYFSKYLKEHYNLKDRRDDSNYNSWNQEYLKFKQDFQKITGKNFDDVVNEYK